jgi:hypothetical protein
MTAIYRKIYEQHYGPIPKDPNGRSMDIHHIDGNHSNNDISNLKLVTVQEHYDIHYAQEDWTACQLLALRLKITPEERSLISSRSNKERIANGTHNLLGGEHQRKQQADRIANGTHHLVGNSLLAQERNSKRLKEGTHNFLIKSRCPHCNKEGFKASMSRNHFDKCKLKINE